MSVNWPVITGVLTSAGVLAGGSIGIIIQGLFARPEKKATIAQLYENLLHNSEAKRLKQAKKVRFLERQHNNDIRELAARDDLLKALLNEVTWSDPELAEKVRKLIERPPDA